MTTLTKEQISAKVVSINPDLAKQWLESLDEIQRPLKINHVKFLASEMKNGRWELTGEPIIFSESGSLLNGQHRLNAIILSEVSVKMLVVQGAKKESYHKMDAGVSRSAADVVSAYGYKNSSTLSSTARLVIAYQQSEKLGGHLNKGKISNDLVLNWIKTSGITDEMIKYAQNSSREFRGIRKVEMAAMKFIHDGINKKDSDTFWNSLVTGVGIDTDSPIYLLRNKFIKDLVGNERLKPTSRIALINKSWNFFRANKQPRTLTWDSKKEGFPYAE